MLDICSVGGGHGCQVVEKHNYLVKKNPIHYMHCFLFIYFF